MNRRSAELPNGSSPPTKIQKQIHIDHETHSENDALPSSSYSIFDDTSIPKLPIEVVSHIFGFMSVRERLNASLVCKEWHEVGSFLCYSRTEKLVFYGSQDFETIISFLLKTKRKILNLEFHRCELSSSNLLLLADRIRYLGFMNCKLSSTLVIELFVKCVNLNEFHSKRNKFDFHFNKEMVKSLEQLEEKHFVNENLKILRVSDDKVPDWCPFNVRSIFKIFPNIQHLGFAESNNHGICTREIVSLKHTLQSLKFSPVYQFSEVRLLMLHDFTRLKRISIFVSSFVPETFIFDCFSRLKCLERISYESMHNSSFPTRFFQHLIHQCSHLKHLKLQFRNDSSIDLSPEMFRSLVSSKLISLKIIDAYFRPTSDQLFTTSINSPVKNTLRVLRIPLTDHRVQSLFIQSFKNLKILQLQCLSGTVLESIGQYQKNLIILKLSLLTYPPLQSARRSICSTDGWHLCQLNNCLQSLTRLENLDLYIHHAHLFDCQFVPLSVKYLSIHNSWAIFTIEQKPLILSLKEKTELEAIHFACRGSADDLSIWSEICCSLNKLRLLSVCSDYIRDFSTLIPRVPDTGLENCQTFCERCPSLRFFVLKTYVFEYDYVDRRMKAIDDLHQTTDFVTINGIADSKVKFRVMYRSADAWYCYD